MHNEMTMTPALWFVRTSFLFLALTLITVPSAAALTPTLLAPRQAARAPEAAPAAAGRLSGIVLDASGAPVPGAKVIVEMGGAQVAETETGPDGRFALTDISAGAAELRATAPGFAAAHLSVPSGAADSESLRVILQPPRLVDSVTVTASRGDRRLNTPAATSVVTSAELLNAAAGAVDDALRNTPGFSLFRRSSSRVANPTTQGVTLRGVSGSGASRTLVLADGLPLNDAFGSWVYWNRIPQASIDRVEVVRGATGDLYGADALGGVIQILTFTPATPRVRAMLDGGSHDTARLSLFGGGKHGAWTGSAAGEWLGTDGVLIVAEDDRGSVDVPAYSDYLTGLATAGYEGGGWYAAGRAAAYSEDRGNGTPLQVNSTDWRQFSGETSGSVAGGSWQVQAGGGTQTYFQTFTAVADDRASERMTNQQKIPTSFGTIGGQWVRPWGSHALLVGAEGKRARSTVEETRFAFATGAPLPTTFVGGTETTGSIYARTSLAVGDRLTIGLGARGDFWNSDSRDAASRGHSANFFNPRASVAWRLRSDVSIQAAAYRTYRTPTLNELYRGFRAGNVVTNPNPLLEPERLTGAEGGVLLSWTRASARVTGFYNRLSEAIANITLQTSPSLITRERQNADTVRAAGLEVESDIRVSSNLSVNALAVWTASNFLDSVKQPALEGNRIPQVPEFQLGAGVTYSHPHIATFTAQLRVVGDQFDDDRNELELDRFAVLDVYAGRSVGRGVQAFIAVENAFDAEYDVGRTPIRTIGWPRTVRGGLRLFLPL